MLHIIFCYKPHFFNLKNKENNDKETERRRRRMVGRNCIATRIAMYLYNERTTTKEQQSLMHHHKLHIVEMTSKGKTETKELQEEQEEEELTRTEEHEELSCITTMLV